MRQTLRACATVLVCAFLTLTSLKMSAQCIAPAMTWSNPTLVSGEALQKGSVYKFPSVTPGVYALVKVEEFKNGATLSSIDDNLYGYPAAWQPVVKTPVVQGVSESWVEFNIRFFDSVDDKKHKYNCMQLSFIDVDGDGQKVQEFVAAKKPDNFMISNISILDITNVGDMVKAMGRIGNYPALDTTSYMTNINYRYYNEDEIDEVWIGNKTAATFIVQDRYSCGYFKQISMPYQVLPVTYSSFTGTVSGNNNVTLDWATVNEQSNSHFEIERSFGNGSGYKTIGKVAENPTAMGGKRSYRFNDKPEELKGQKVAFYRLKQVDLDGKINYSEVLAVVLKSKNAGTLQVYPNPFADKLELRFSVEVDANVEIRIVDYSGRVILVNRTQVERGLVQVKVGGLQQLKPGAYIAQLIIEGQVVESQKVVKN